MIPLPTRRQRLEFHKDRLDIALGSSFDGFVKKFKTPWVFGQAQRPLDESKRVVNFFGRPGPGSGDNGNRITATGQSYHKKELDSFFQL